MASRRDFLKGLVAGAAALATPRAAEALSELPQPTAEDIALDAAYKAANPRLVVGPYVAESDVQQTARYLAHTEAQYSEFRYDDLRKQIIDSAMRPTPFAGLVKGVKA